LGAAEGERWFAALPRLWRWTVDAAFFIGLAVRGLFIGALTLPLASGSSLRDFAHRNNGDLREETAGTSWSRGLLAFGIHSGFIASGTARQYRRVGGELYGEQGSIEILGRAYHLPAPISETNGLSRRYVERTFTDCRLTGHNGNPYGVENEESREHPDIFVRGAPRMSWPEFWKQYPRFG
jgi:hypothetical protein